MARPARRRYTDPDVLIRRIGAGIGLLVCLLLAAYTGNKLRRMLVIRGVLGGARTVTVTITGKHGGPGMRSPVYTVVWHSAEPGPHQLNLGYDEWEGLSVGDPLEIVYVGNDRSPYYARGIYASTGNVGFDMALLLAELAGVGACALRLARGR